MNKKLYGIGAGIWFIAWGLLSISNFEFQFSAAIMGLLAVAVGVLMLLDR